jgi:Right handed beta helix region
LTYLVSGRYNLSHSVILSSNSGIIGDGQGTQLFLSDDSDHDLLVIPSDSTNCIVSNLYLNGNKSHNKLGSGIVIHGYSWRSIVQHVTIRDCAENGLRTTGDAQGYVYEPIFYDLDVRNFGLDGLNFGFCSDAYGENVYSEGNAGAGVQHFDVAGTWIHEHATFNFGEYGIIVGDTSSDLRFSETHIDKNQQNGMLLMGKRNTISGAFIFNSGQIYPNMYDGLVIKNATECIISGCIITDYQGNKTQRRGIYETGESDYNTIEGNNLNGCIEPSTIIGVHNVIKFNQGFITENQGVARIQANSKSIRVQHGCQFTPEPGDVQVRPASSLSNCTQFWVFEVDSTGFTISLDGFYKNPVDFAWSVDRH